MAEEKKELGLGGIITPKEKEIQDYIEKMLKRSDALKCGIADAMEMHHNLHKDVWDFITGKYPETKNKACILAKDKDTKEWYIMVTGNATQ